MQESQDELDFAEFEEKPILKKEFKTELIFTSNISTNIKEKKTYQRFNSYCEKYLNKKPG